MSEIKFSVFPSENFIDLGLYQYGWEKCDPAHSYGPVARNHYLFHYVLSGTGTLISTDTKGDSQEYRIKSGQGFMIFPQQICTYYADKDLPWEYTWLEFDGLKVKEALDITGLSMDRPIYRSRDKEQTERMKQEMLYIADHTDSSAFHLIGHLYLFLDHFVRSISPIDLTLGNNLQDFYIKEAISYIEQNFQNDISIERIATACGLNRSYFGKIFRQKMGRSPQDFLISYRLTKATELLKMTDLSITNIANAIGYPNPLHFSRAFKHVYGVSPREWRHTHVVKFPKDLS